MDAGGVTEIDSRSSSEAIRDAYGEAGLGGVLHNKAENFITMVGGGPMVTFAKAAVEAAGSGELGLALREVRTILFFYLLPSLGLLLGAPFAMLIGRRRAHLRPIEWSFAMTCLALVGLGALIWGLLLFGTEPDRASIQDGSLLLPVLALCGCVAGLRATFPRFANWLVGVSAALMLAIYVPSTDPIPGSAFSAIGALLAAASIVGFGLVAFRAGAARQDGASLPAETAWQ